MTSRSASPLELPGKCHTLTAFESSYKTKHVSPRICRRSDSVMDRRKLTGTTKFAKAIAKLPPDDLVRYNILLRKLHSSNRSTPTDERT